MKILGIECSASPVSVAISDNGKIISNDFSNTKVTHSQTLMPMVETVLKNSGLNLNDIDAFAVAAGPGSFTGIRIGISAVKGMAFPENKPCYPVSTLEGIAYLFKNYNGIICPVMDARCNQVYNALFKVQNGTVKRLCDDRALMCNDLANEIKDFKEQVFICGDGTDVFSPFVSDMENVTIIQDNQKYQNATGVVDVACNGNIYSCLPKDLLPVYLRLPQAERELKQKKGL